jgi:hypothetical protein
MRSITSEQIKDIIDFQKMKHFLNLEALRASPNGSINAGFKIISGKQHVYYDGEINKRKVKIFLSPIVGDELVFAVILFLNNEKVYTIPKIEFSRDIRTAQKLLNHFNLLIMEGEKEVVRYGKS